jgi:hypothetical protein
MLWNAKETTPKLPHEEERSWRRLKQERVAGVPASSDPSRIERYHITTVQNSRCMRRMHQVGQQVGYEGDIARSTGAARPDIVEHVLKVMWWKRANPASTRNLVNSYLFVKVHTFIKSLVQLSIRYFLNEHHARSGHSAALK